MINGSYYTWFWGMINKVLPTVYDDSLSYYEVLNKLTRAMGEYGKALDDVLDDADTAVEQAQASAESAQESATTAVNSASQAVESAQSAQQSASTASSVAETKADLAVAVHRIYPWTAPAYGVDASEVLITQSGYTCNISAMVDIEDASDFEQDEYYPILFGGIPHPFNPANNEIFLTARIEKTGQNVFDYAYLVPYDEDNVDGVWGVRLGNTNLSDNDRVFIWGSYNTADRFSD